MMRSIVSFILFGYHAISSLILPPACRFYPSCSVYASQAIQKYGILKGLLRGLHRLSRCHPGTSGGYDPVI